MKMIKELRITVILHVIILTVLLIMLTNASLENAGKFQLHSLPGLVDRFHNDHIKIIIRTPPRSLSATIDRNNPPEALVSLSGSSSVEIGTSYIYTTSTKDPDGDKLRYTFYWGDGTTSVTGLVDSGKSANATHIWSKAGAYQVKVMATDSISAHTQWSPSLAVTVNTPPNKTTTLSGFNLSMANTLNLHASAVIRAKSFKKYLYAFPAPNPLNITGLSGSISLNNTVSNLAQALITVWVNPDGYPESGARFDTYDQIFHEYPNSIILFRYILKSSQPEIVSIPTDFTLPIELPVNGWIFTVLDGGEPAYGGQVALTSDMALHYNTSSHPINPPQVVPLDYEYCYGQNWGCQLHSPRTSGKEAFAYVQPITSYTYLWQLTGDVSAGAFTGSPYSNSPVGPWVANFDFYVYPDCAGMKSGPQGPDDYYSKIPPSAIRLDQVQLSGNGNVTKNAEMKLNGNGNATKLAELQLNGNGKVALQQPTVRQFSPMLLRPGNCLVCLAKFIAPSGGATLESQIQVLLQDIGARASRVQAPVLEEANEQYRKLLKEKDQYLTCDHCQARLN